MINLSNLNSYVTHAKSKEMAYLVLGLIRKEDFMFLVDLKDDYFQGLFVRTFNLISESHSEARSTSSMLYDLAFL